MYNSETTINIPFKLRVRESSEHPMVPFAYVDHDLLSLSAYLPESKAKKQFRKQLAETIEQGLRAIKHYERRTFQTVQGDVFTVYWSPISDCWGYDIAGNGRKYTTSCPDHSAKNFKECYARAKKHAVDCFGGIAWE